jgi:hypothetical protein
MRILVVVPHYSRRLRPENPAAVGYGGYIDPIGRIAAFNEMLVALHGNFGPNPYALDGEATINDRVDPAHRLDIIVLTQRDHNLLPFLGLAPGTFEIEYVEGEPLLIPFHAPTLLRKHLGRYDFYCVVEDDLIIRDPAFFEKLTWFQQNFGPKTLLAPVRFEMVSTGTPAKVVIEPRLSKDHQAPFRRPHQTRELEGVWCGHRQRFRLPNNPHAASFFLTPEQMAYWVDQPSFDDRDSSWIGPLESALTLCVGKVFDIYKSSSPNPFFLEIQHFGVRFAGQSTPPGGRRGEPPLLAIAQNALRAAFGRDGGTNGVAASEDADRSFASLVERWIAQGTVAEHRARIEVLTAELERYRTPLWRRWKRRAMRNIRKLMP